jgi:hypothetical protein
MRWRDERPNQRGEAMNLRTTALAAGVAAALGLAGTAPAQTVETVMSGLDNPRGLAFAPNGALYVTEAGVGGPPNIPHANNCALNTNTNEYRCYGDTGRIRRLRKGDTEPQIVVDRLPSHAVYNHANQVAFPNGSSAAGPNDISFVGTGSAYVTLGLGGDEAFQDQLGTGAPLFGTMLQIPASGRWRVVADVFAHEVEQNPAGAPIDSNPYGVLAEPGVRYVADAGANALLAVWASGHIETVAVFPKVPWTFPGLPPQLPNPTDPVPTSVARGPDGALYVGMLTGAPFAPGTASVYRVVPGEAPTVYVGGFKAITDIAFDDEGGLYVLEHSTGGPFFSPNSGKLTRVAPAPDLTKTEVKSGLNRPTSVAIGPDGAIYVTNNGVFPGIGQVLKLTP